MFFFFLWDMDKATWFQFLDRLQESGKCCIDQLIVLSPNNVSRCANRVYFPLKKQDVFIYWKCVDLVTWVVCDRNSSVLLQPDSCAPLNNICDYVSPSVIFSGVCEVKLHFYYIGLDINKKWPSIRALSFSFNWPLIRRRDACKEE